MKIYVIFLEKKLQKPFFSPLYNRLLYLPTTPATTYLSPRIKKI